MSPRGKKRKAENATNASAKKPLTNEELRQLLDAERRARQAAEQRSAADRQRAEAERQRAEAERQRAEDEMRARQDAEQQAATDRRLRLGTYYATFDEVWGPVGEPFAPSHYEAMTRAGYPSYQTATNDTRWTSRFETTMHYALDSNYDVAIGHGSIASSRASSRGSSRDPGWNAVTWPVDVLKSRFLHRDNSDLFIQIRGASQEPQPPNNAKRSANAHIAHLVPASEKFATLYHHVAIWVFGVQGEKRDDAKFVQKLIHGSVVTKSVQNAKIAKSRAKRPLPHETTISVQSSKYAKRSLDDPPQSEAAENPRPAMRTTRERASNPPFEQDSTFGNRSRLGSTGLENGSEAWTRSRVDHTGLKHMICNKIRLGAQGVFFDTNPCLIIVPVLSLKQARDWNGEGYDALFMISTGVKTIEGQQPPSTVDRRTPQALDDVANGVNLRELGAVANESEIECAKNLLSVTLKGLAFSLWNKSDDRDKWVSALTEDWKAELVKVRNVRSVVTGESQVIVPKKRNNTKPVRKITFAPAFGHVGENGHPAPDPLLLVVKSALNWSWFHNKKLMAAGELGESDCEMSERSIASMEQYDEQAFRHEEIMKMGEIVLNPRSTKKSDLAGISNGPTRACAHHKQPNTAIHQSEMVTSNH